MANIATEIKNFLSAVYGKDVRASLVSLAEKLNSEVEDNTRNVTNAVQKMDDDARKIEEYGNEAKNDAARARMYANFVEPDFILQDNRIYVLEDKTVEFIVSDNRLCFKLLG